MKTQAENKPTLTLHDYVEKFNQLSTIFDAMPTGVFAILDPKLNIATINKAASLILGNDSEMFIGKMLGKFLNLIFQGYSN